MKSFTYTIKDPVGIHARPAGLLTKAAKGFPGCKIVLENGEKKVEMTRLMALMGMGVGCGDCITVSAEGANEEAALAAVQQVFRDAEL